MDSDDAPLSELFRGSSRGRREVVEEIPVLDPGRYVILVWNIDYGATPTEPNYSPRGGHTAPGHSVLLQINMAPTTRQAKNSRPNMTHWRKARTLAHLDNAEKNNTPSSSSAQEPKSKLGALLRAASGPLDKVEQDSPLALFEVWPSERFRPRTEDMSKLNCIAALAGVEKGGTGDSEEVMLVHGQMPHEGFGIFAGNKTEEHLELTIDLSGSQGLELANTGSQGSVIRHNIGRLPVTGRDASRSDSTIVSNGPVIQVRLDPGQEHVLAAELRSVATIMVPSYKFSSKIVTSQSTAM